VDFLKEFLVLHFRVRWVNLNSFFMHLRWITGKIIMMMKSDADVTVLMKKAPVTRSNQTWSCFFPVFMLLFLLC